MKKYSPRIHFFYLALLLLLINSMANAEYSGEHHNFPCEHPINSFKRSFEARKNTFNTNWEQSVAHKNLIHANPERIASAGLYYLGERDRVKCWYCNGGLQNWQSDDDPWEEHTRWFPECEFVLREKGELYVKSIVEKHLGNIDNRPYIFYPSTYNSEIMREIRTMVIPTYTNTASSNGSLDAIFNDPIAAMEASLEKVETDPAVNAVAEMGIDISLIKAFLCRFYLNLSPNTQRKADLQVLTDEIFSAEESETQDLQRIYTGLQELVRRRQSSEWTYPNRID